MFIEEHVGTLIDLLIQNKCSYEMINAFIARDLFTYELGFNVFLRDLEFPSIVNNYH